MKLNFLEFVYSLTNFEKMRDFQKLKSYNLDFFEKYVAKKNSFHAKKTIRISVVGTNGKGSVCHYLSELFQNQGLKVGTYTSPHLISPLERIKIQNKEIPLEDYNNLLLEIYDQDLANLSFFEIFTLFAILLFGKNQCEVEIYEAGLGGRLDATKVAKSEYIVLTAIGKDHTEILGESLEKILDEKLNIASERTKTIFAFCQSDSITKQIEGFCANIYFSPFQQKVQSYNDYLQFNFEYAKFVCRSILQNEKQIKGNFSDFSKTSKPRGRMEVLSQNPLLIFDTAHNLDATKILFETVQKSYPNRKFHIFVGFLKDKNLNQITNLLSNCAFCKSVKLLEGNGFSHYENLPFEKMSIEKLSIYLKELKEDCLIFGSFKIYPKLCLE